MQEHDECTSLHSRSVHSLWSLCGESVRVELTDGSAVCGCVYTIDPVSATVVLVEFDPANGEARAMQVLPGESIASLAIADAACGSSRCPASSALNDWMAGLFGGVIAAGTSSVEERARIERRRVALKTWFERNHIPVKEEKDGALAIFDAVRIVAPFSSDQCYCDNELVLGKVRRLIEAMPEDDDRGERGE